MSESLVEIARRQIQFARDYTLSLIEDVDDSLWYFRPHDSVTHVAWQVGHLAMAEYGLCLFRIRGRTSADSELMSSAFRKKFMRGTTPVETAENNPSPEEIRDVLQRVHERAMRELAVYDDAQLQDPIDEPYAVFNTKLGALLFCSKHEMLHAGQIGLLRRFLGKSPRR